MDLSFLDIAFLILHLVGLSSAFVSPVGRLSQKGWKLSAEDWDNDDFMESLSKPPDDEDSGQYKKRVPSDEDEVSQGGSRFQQMMEAAQAAGPRRPPMPDPPTSPSPQSLVTQSMENMSVDEQAAMFRAMMQGKQSQSTPQPSQNFQPPGVDAKGRKIGRNRDADQIANTSDLYFAQLKRDSAARTMARLRGEDDVAEKVFEDESVKELSQIRTNPHLEREREEQENSNQEAIENVMNAMMADQAQQKGKKRETQTNGPNYKELLEARKKRKSSTNTVTSVLAPDPEPIQMAEKQNTAQDSATEAFQIVESEKAPAVPASSPKLTQIKDMIPPKKEFISSEPKEVSQSLQDNEDDTRRKLRTIMGMFLKHRGGKGFGSGLLRGKEADDFEKLLKEVGSQLRKEAGSREDAVSDTPVSATAPASEPIQTVPETIPVPPPAAREVEVPASPDIVVPAPAAQQVEAPRTPAVVFPPPALPAQTTALTTAKTDAYNNASVGAALTCVEGAIQMYKNSPAELSDGMLMALRAALQNASNKCSQVIEGDSQ